MWLWCDAKIFSSCFIFFVLFSRLQVLFLFCVQVFLLMIKRNNTRYEVVVTTNTYFADKIDIKWRDFGLDVHAQSESKLKQQL